LRSLVFKVVQSSIYFIQSAFFDFLFIVTVTFGLHVVEHLTHSFGNFFIFKSWTFWKSILHFLQETWIKIFFWTLKAHSLWKFVQVFFVWCVKFSEGVLDGKVFSKIECKSFVVVDLHENRQKFQIANLLSVGQIRSFSCVETYILGSTFRFSMDLINQMLKSRLLREFDASLFFEWNVQDHFITIENCVEFWDVVV
jgi:hypothetical protein